MGLQNFFIEGLDPTGLPAFGASEALQLIRAAKTPSYIGMVFVGPAAPDMVSNPQYSTFLWHNTTTGVVSRWTGATWLPISIGIGSLSGTVITDGTLPWTKINLAGSTALYLIRVNAANNALEYVSAANLFGAGSFAVNKLVPGINGQFLRTVLGAATWSTLTSAEIISIISANSIPLNYLAYSGAGLGTVLTIGGAGTPMWQTLPASPTPMPTIPTIVPFYASGAWIVPAGITKIRLRAWGAGGGGQTLGGGGGGYSECIATVTPAAVLTVTIGAGGIGYRTAGPSDATNGGATQVTDPTPTILVNANGGYNGKAIVDGGPDGVGASADVSATIALKGGDGYLQYGVGGHGGHCPQGGFGGNGSYNMTGILAQNGSGPGGGGGGGYSLPGTWVDGGDGAAGMVVIEY